GRRAVLRHQRLDPERTEAVRRRLGAEVAGDLAGAPEVRPDQGEDVRVDLAALDEAYGRNDQPFLVDLARHADAARGAPAHIHMVRDVRHVAEEGTLVKD